MLSELRQDFVIVGSKISIESMAPLSPACRKFPPRIAIQRRFQQNPAINTLRLRWLKPSHFIQYETKRRRRHKAFGSIRIEEGQPPRP